MDIAPVSFDTRGHISRRALFFLGAIVIVVMALMWLLESNAPILVVLGVAAVGSAFLVGAYLFRLGPKPNHYTYLSIDSDGVHFRDHSAAPEQLVDWDRIQSVKSVWDDSFLGFELQVSAPAGWPQRRQVPVRYRDHLDDAVLLIQRVIDARSHSARQHARA